MAMSHRPGNRLQIEPDNWVGQAWFEVGPHEVEQYPRGDRRHRTGPITMAAALVSAVSGARCW